MSGLARPWFPACRPDLKRRGESSLRCPPQADPPREPLPYVVGLPQPLAFPPWVLGCPSCCPLPVLVVISALHAPRWLCNEQMDVGTRRWAVEGLAYLTFDADVKEEFVEDAAALKALFQLSKVALGFLQSSRDADSD